MRGSDRSGNAPNPEMPGMAPPRDHPSVVLVALPIQDPEDCSGSIRCSVSTKKCFFIDTLLLFACLQGTPERFWKILPPPDLSVRPVVSLPNWMEKADGASASPNGRDHSRETGRTGVS